MSPRNILASALILVSLGCLIPGLWQPIFSIEVGANLPLVGTILLYESKQSILQTIETLHKNNNSLVAFLILFFSVLVPLIKAVSLLALLFIKKLQHLNGLHRFVAIISKWSMADVFVVGVLLAFLATRSNDAIEAQLHTGFYWFLAYCILSIGAAQIMSLDKAGIHT